MNTRTQKLLAAILVMQVLTLLGQWFNPSYTSTASAQVPDAGAQRIAIKEEIRGTNQRLDKLIGLIEGGQLQVRVAQPDDKQQGR